MCVIYWYLYNIMIPIPDTYNICFTYFYWNIKHGNSPLRLLTTSRPLRSVCPQFKNHCSITSETRLLHTIKIKIQRAGAKWWCKSLRAECIPTSRVACWDVRHMRRQDGASTMSRWRCVRVCTHQPQAIPPHLCGHHLALGTLHFRPSLFRV